MCGGIPCSILSLLRQIYPANIRSTSAARSSQGLRKVMALWYGWMGFHHRQKPPAPNFIYWVYSGHAGRNVFRLKAFKFSTILDMLEEMPLKRNKLGTIVCYNENKYFDTW